MSTLRIIMEQSAEFNSPLFLLFVDVKQGVKQGCVLSPLLFLLTLDWVMRKVNAGGRGIQWTLTSRLEDIDFADDFTLMAHSVLFARLYVDL